MRTRKELSLLNDMIHDVGQRKNRAAKYRFRDTHSKSEPSRQVYLESCARIASTFEPLGYKYTKSSPHIHSSSGIFGFQVSFQSSHNNIPGEYVALWLHVYVLSKHLKKWRTQQPHSVRQTEYIAGGQIGSLRGDPTWMEWNLASPKIRKETVDDATKAITQIALPYFAQFDDLSKLIDKLKTHSIPAMDIGSTIEFLLCFGTPQAAILAGRNFLSDHPDLMKEFLHKVSEYKKQGLPKFSIIGTLPELAFLSVAHDLSFF